MKYLTSEHGLRFDFCHFEPQKRCIYPLFAPLPLSAALCV